MESMKGGRLVVEKRRIIWSKEWGKDSELYRGAGF